MLSFLQRPTMRVIYPGLEPENGNKAQHFEPSGQLDFPRGKTHYPGNEGQPQPLAPPRPPIDPSAELQQQRQLLAHLESQLTTAKAALEATPQNFFTSIADTAPRQKQYTAMLRELKDLAAQPFIDLPLLVQVLERPYSEGLIPATRQRIANLADQLRTPPRPSEEYRRLVTAEEKAFRAWGKARQARRKHEQENLAPSARHELRGPRPAFGINFAHIDGKTLDRVAAFAVSLPDSK